MQQGWGPAIVNRRAFAFPHPRCAVARVRSAAQGIDNLTLAAPGFDGAMTKAENRAAARAYHQERMRKLDEEAKAARIFRRG